MPLQSSCALLDVLGSPIDRPVPCGSGGLARRPGTEDRLGARPKSSRLTRRPAGRPEVTAGRTVFRGARRMGASVTAFSASARDWAASFGGSSAGVTPTDRRAEFDRRDAEGAAGLPSAVRAWRRRTSAGRDSTGWTSVGTDSAGWASAGRDSAGCVSSRSVSAGRRTAAPFALRGATAPRSEPFEGAGVGSIGRGVNTVVDGLSRCAGGLGGSSADDRGVGGAWNAAIGAAERVAGFTTSGPPDDRCVGGGVGSSVPSDWGVMTGGRNSAAGGEAGGRRRDVAFGSLSRAESAVSCPMVGEPSIRSSWSLPATRRFRISVVDMSRLGCW